MAADNIAASAISRLPPAPRVLGVARDIVATWNIARGERSSARLSSEHFTIVSARPHNVIFTGKVVLSTTVTGPGGASTTDDVISGPVVADNSNGGWHVVSFLYDGSSLTLYLEQAHQTVSGVTLEVGYAAAVGQSAAAFVQITGMDESTPPTVVSSRLSAGASSERAAPTSSRTRRCTAYFSTRRQRACRPSST